MGSVQAAGKEIDLKKYKAVIFDFDGTLYDFSNIAINLILARPIDLFHLHAERLARRLLKGKWFGGKESYDEAHENLMYEKNGFRTPDEALAWYKGPCLDNMVKVLKKKYHARPHAREVFSLLKSHDVKTCVLSDYIRTSDRMTAIGLEGVADYMLSSEEFGGLKPALKVFEHVASLLECEPGEILVVGDRGDTDGEGALQSGMDFIQIDDGKRKTKKHALKVPHTALSWDKFISLVEKAFSEKLPA